MTDDMKVNSVISFSASRKHALKRDGYRCVICGETVGLQVDHIRPLCEGGSNNLENLQTLCHRCHIRKTKKENSAPSAIENFSQFELFEVFNEYMQYLFDQDPSTFEEYSKCSYNGILLEWLFRYDRSKYEEIYRQKLNALIVE